MFTFRSHPFALIFLAHIQVDRPTRPIVTYIIPRQTGRPSPSALASAARVARVSSISTGPRSLLHWKPAWMHATLSLVGTSSTAIIARTATAVGSTPRVTSVLMRGGSSTQGMWYVPRRCRSLGMVLLAPPQWFQADLLCFLPSTPHHTQPHHITRRHAPHTPSPPRGHRRPSTLPTLCPRFSYICLHSPIDAKLIAQRAPSLPACYTPKQAAPQPLSWRRRLMYRECH